MKKETEEKIERIGRKFEAILTGVIIVISPFAAAWEMYKICNGATGKSLYWDLFLLAFYGSFPVWSCMWIYKALKKANYRLGYLIGFFESVEKKAKEAKEAEAAEKEVENEQ